MKKVSLIIPVYNTEKYLEQCLKSAVNQSYSNIEIICIDDGSTDTSGKIIDDFAKTYKNIIVIHQDNKGESAARNKGIRAASGHYIGFMDCDDWIELDMYQKLVAVMEQKSVDIVAASWFNELETESIPIQNKKIVETEVFGRRQLLQYIYERDAYRGFAYMWNKLYRRDLFCNAFGQELLFDESLLLGGDVLMLAQLALNVHSAFYLDIPFYHYRQREASGCHTTNLQKRNDWIKAYSIVVEIFEEADIDEDIINLVKRFMAYHSSNAAELAYQQGNLNVLRENQKIMEKYSDIYRRLNLSNPQYIHRYNKILNYSL